MSTIKKNNNKKKSYSFGIISLNTGQSSFNKITNTDLEKGVLNIFDELNKLDIIIIGLQEDRSNSGSTKFFTKYFKNHKFIKKEYIKGIIKSKFVMIKLIILSKEPLISSEIKLTKICDHSSCVIGLCCSKGLVAIKINNTLIINNHLLFKSNDVNTGQGFKERICQMSKLYNKLKKNNKQNLDHEKDNIIWFGDLNFRVDQNILSNLYSNSKNSKNSKKLIKNKYLNLIHSMINEQTNQSTLKRGFKKSLNKYLEMDQLKMLQQKNKDENTIKSKCKLPFPIYENKITFNPTCKLVEGSKNIYQVISKNKPRIPSWCDRIIFNENTKNNFKIKYNSMFLPINSDHHAVYGIFNPIK
jgi:hypothetical protein